MTDSAFLQVLKELSLRVHLDVAKNHVMSDLLVRAIRFDKADDSMLDSAPPSPMNTAQAAEDKWWHGLESLVTENQSECFILPGAKFPNRMPATGTMPNTPHSPNDGTSSAWMRYL